METSVSCKKKNICVEEKSMKHNLYHYFCVLYTLDAVVSETI